MFCDFLAAEVVDWCAEDGFLDFVGEAAVGVLAEVRKIASLFEAGNKGRKIGFLLGGEVGFVVAALES